MAPFGNKWTFNYGGYVSIGVDNAVTVNMPDGRLDVFKNPDAQGIYSVKPLGVFNTLTRVSDSRYALTFLNGTIYIYDILAGNSQRASLTQVSDAYGQSLIFGYQNNTLISITDALNNNPTTFTYYSDRVVVTDPFNRTAEFTFDASHNLISATDMGGYVTTYTYDVNGNSYLTSITNPKGTWAFKIEPNDGRATAAAYPAPDDPLGMGNNYRVTITDPLSHPEEYYYNGPTTWYVSPRDYVPYNATTGANNLTKARKTTYFINRSLSRVNGFVTPENNLSKYIYDPVILLPVTVTDGNNHTTHYQYNLNGLITKFWDAKTATTSTPTIFYTYYPNGIDVQTIDNGLGVPIAYEYNGSHDVTAVTDHTNVRSEFGYNAMASSPRLSRRQTICHLRPRRPWITIRLPHLANHQEGEQSYRHLCP